MVVQAVVRAASPSDAATLGRLLFDFNREFDTDTDDADVLAERFGRILADPAVFAVLAVDSGTPVGFGLVTLRPAIWFDGPVSTLEELYVVPERRGGGTGTALLAAARRLSLEHGSPEMQINVDEVDEDARRFYERHGFVNVEAGTTYRMLCYFGPNRR